jgi:hypothetical protein
MGHWSVLRSVPGEINIGLAKWRPLFLAIGEIGEIKKTA